MERAGGECRIELPDIALLLTNCSIELVSDASLEAVSSGCAKDDGARTVDTTKGPEWERHLELVKHEAREGLSR